jgi:hypothetical protein
VTAVLGSMAIANNLRVLERIVPDARETTIVQSVLSVCVHFGLLTSDRHKRVISLYTFVWKYMSSTIAYWTQKQETYRFFMVWLVNNQEHIRVGAIKVDNTSSCP